MLSEKYKKYKNEIGSMAIKKQDAKKTLDQKKTSASKSFVFSGNEAERHQRIVEFLAGKHDGLISGIVRAQRPNFLEHHQDAEKSK